LEYNKGQVQKKGNGANRAGTFVHLDFGQQLRSGLVNLPGYALPFEAKAILTAAKAMSKQPRLPAGM
jgi:hypothetical protein